MPQRKTNNSSKFMLRMMGLPWKFRHRQQPKMRQIMKLGQGRHTAQQQTDRPTDMSGGDDIG
jgi:ABC-type iron transport system FetAB ATPase subunit